MGIGSSTRLPRDVAALYEKTWQRQDQYSQPRLIQNFDQHVQQILESLHKADDKPFKQRMGLTKSAGDKLVETDTIEAICNELVASLCRKKEQGKRAKDVAAFNGGGRSEREFVENCLECLSIVTTPLTSEDACWEVAHHKKLVPELLSILQDRNKASMKGVRFYDSLRIVHNLAVHEAELKDGYNTPDPPSDEYGRDNQFRANLAKLELALTACAKLDEKAAQLAAVTALACVRTHSVTVENIDFLLLNLRLALDNTDHQRMDCSATAMERGIRHLLKSAPVSDKGKTTEQADKKRALIEAGAVAVLAKGMKSEIEEEKRACIDSLWFLCQEEKCQREMVENEDLVDILTKLYRDKSNPMQEQAEFILLNLIGHMGKGHKKVYFGKGDGGKGLDMEKRQEEAAKKQDKRDTYTSSRPGHVMLSYNTGSRATVEALCERLQNEGIDTWMDKDDMHKKGDTLDSMAAAVDNCSVFLLCYTEAYENSQDCRQEARYARTKKKPIVPVKLQADYEGDQWLGFMISGLYNYDLTGSQQSNEQTFRKLVATIRDQLQGKRSGNKRDSPPKSLALQPAALQSPRKEEKLDTSRSVKSQRTPMTRTPRNATMNHFCRLHPNSVHGSLEECFGHCCCYYSDPRKEVRDWAMKFKLDSHEVKSLTKKDIDILVQLKAEAPEFFYRRIWADLRLKKLSEIQQFEKALNYWAKKAG